MKQKEKTRKSLYISQIFILGLVFVAFYEVQQHNWSDLFVVMQAIVFSLIPYFLEIRYKIYTPDRLKLLIALFMFATLFLGEINDFYVTFWWWDILLHFTAGFGAALIGFIILATIYKESNLKSTPFLTLLFALSFSLGVSVVWEIYEFFLDMILNQHKMQPSLADTMWDLIAAFCGGLLASMVGWSYLRVKYITNPFEKIIEDGVKENHK